METNFTAPEGFDFEGMEEGEEKEVLAKVRYMGNGQFALGSVDGYALGESEEPEMEEEEMEGEGGGGAEGERERKRKKKRDREREREREREK